MGQAIRISSREQGSNSRGPMVAGQARSIHVRWPLPGSAGRMVCGAQSRHCQWTPLGSGARRADAIVAIDGRISAHIAASQCQ